MGRDVGSVVYKMQVALDRSSFWLLEWVLVVNPATRKRITNLPQYVLNDVNIPLVATHKFLGMHLDAPLLIWKEHVANMDGTCS